MRAACEQVAQRPERRRVRLLVRGERFPDAGFSQRVQNRCGSVGHPSDQLAETFGQERAVERLLEFIALAEDREHGPQAPTGTLAQICAPVIQQRGRP